MKFKELNARFNVTGLFKSEHLNNLANSLINQKSDLVVQSMIPIMEDLSDLKTINMSNTFFSSYPADELLI